MNNPLLPCQRHLFDIPDDIAYFNCAYLAPNLKTVRSAGHTGVDKKSAPWQIVPDDFFSETEVARNLFAQLIRANSGDIAIIPSVSYGVAIAAANVELKAGENIVLLAEQFPSNVYPWRDLTEKKNATIIRDLDETKKAKIITVDRDANFDWTTPLIEAISEQTAIVAIPQVHWTDGTLIDLNAVSRKCREVDAALVLDLTQSLGALPFSIAEIQPDFVISAAYKWLLGPFSFGFMYVSPEHQQAGRPLEHNWLNRENSEDFAGLVNYRDAYQPGARRFDVGERCNFALMPMATAALEQIHTWGVPNIQRTLASFTQRIIEHAQKLGLQTAPAKARAGHMLGVRFPDGLPEGLMEKLAQEKVFVSRRGNAIRIAPHLYNNETDLQKLLDVLEKCV